MNNKMTLWRFAIGLSAFSLLYLALYFYDTELAMLLKQKYRSYFYLVGLSIILLTQIGTWKAANEMEKSDPQKAKKLRSYVKQISIAVIIYIACEFL